MSNSHGPMSGVYYGDSLNRLIGRAEPPIGISDPNYGQLVTVWYYDDDGNLTRLMGPDGGITDYAYDERNRMTTVIRKDTENDPNPRITTYDYYENNLLKLKTLPNGCEAYHEYDELDRLTLLVNRKSDDTVISSFNIEYRDDDNKSKITREDGTVIEYDYDEQKRLTKEKWTASGGSVLHDFQYGYDAAGNRLTKVYNGVTTEYDYNNLNQLTQESTGCQVTTYGYDKEGNTVGKTEPAKETLYSWNHENMLTKAEFSDSTPTNYFTYDGDNVRVEKVDSQGRRQYHWDGLHELLERDGETILQAFVHGEEEIHGVGSLLLAEEDAGDMTYTLEPMGHVGELTDMNENVLTDLEYDAFGGRPTGEGDAHTGRGFVGKERDDDLGLWAFQARVYDPGTGRFVTRDPLQAGANQYTYAEADPVNWSDPSGLVGIRDPHTQLLYNPDTKMFRFIDKKGNVDRWWSYEELRDSLMGTGATASKVNEWVWRAKEEQNQAARLATLRAIHALDFKDFLEYRKRRMEEEELDTRHRPSPLLYDMIAADAERRSKMRELQNIEVDRALFIADLIMIIVPVGAAGALRVLRVAGVGELTGIATESGTLRLYRGMSLKEGWTTRWTRGLVPTPAGKTQMGGYALPPEIYQSSKLVANFPDIAETMGRLSAKGRRSVVAVLEVEEPYFKSAVDAGRILREGSYGPVGWKYSIKGIDAYAVMDTEVAQFNQHAKIVGFYFGKP